MGTRRRNHSVPLILLPWTMREWHPSLSGGGQVDAVSSRRHKVKVSNAAETSVNLFFKNCRPILSKPQNFPTVFTESKLAIYVT